MYRQMNRGLRNSFAPVFLLFELKTIVLCLRNKTVEKAIAIDRLLERSLLADALRRALDRGTDTRSTLAALTEAMSGTSERFRELGSAYAEGGLKGLEDSLVRVFLEYVTKEELHHVIEAFFVSFIDLRNTMILYKHLRWRLDDNSAFIPGGSIETARFRRILARKDEAGLDSLVRGLAGPKTIPVAAGEAALETVLLRGMTTKQQRIGREGEDVGLILDYVWRLYVQARNLAVLHHAKGLDVDTLEKELIL